MVSKKVVKFEFLGFEGKKFNFLGLLNVELHCTK